MVDADAVDAGLLQNHTFDLVTEVGDGADDIVEKRVVAVGGALCAAVAGKDERFGDVRGGELQLLAHAVQMPDVAAGEGDAAAVA